MVAKLTAVLAVLSSLLISGCATMQSNYDAPVPFPTVPAAIPTTAVVPLPAQKQTTSADETIQETPIIAPSGPTSIQPRLSTEAALPALLATKPSNNTFQHFKSPPNTNYSENCACPEDVDSAGRRCGLRSAYSKAGGSSPTCNGKAALASEVPAQPTYSPSYNGTPPATGYGVISKVTGLPRTSYVHGYTRKNGTYVQPYYRSRRR